MFSKLTIRNLKSLELPASHATHTRFEPRVPQTACGEPNFEKESTSCYRVHDPPYRRAPLLEGIAFMNFPRGILFRRN